MAEVLSSLGFKTSNFRTYVKGDVIVSFSKEVRAYALPSLEAVEVFCRRCYVGVQETLESVKEKILVVDDEASIRRILETRLSMIGYDVVTAADGEEALDTFRHEIPDLVVLGCDDAQARWLRCLSGAYAKSPIFPSLC